MGGNCPRFDPDITHRGYYLDPNMYEIRASKLRTVIKVYIIDLHLLVNPRSLWYKVCAIFQVGSFLYWVAF